MLSILRTVPSDFIVQLFSFGGLNMLSPANVLELTRVEFHVEFRVELRLSGSQPSDSSDSSARNNI